VIPVRGPRREVLDEPITVDGLALRYSAATIGNPHCVVPLAEVNQALACRLGPLLENDPRFPNRSNVQLLKVLDRANIRIEIWERGAGYTLASGSSSSAAGAVARRLGLVDAEVAVHMPGGIIQLHIDATYAVTMTGPTVFIGEMRFAGG
jgi:diaminopimelate epimerase